MYKNQLYRLGWKLWLFQNIIILIPFIACIPVVSSILFQYVVSLDMVNETSTILNYIFTFALLLDLISVLFISISSFFYLSSLKKEVDFKRKEFFIPISGFLWIIFSLLWRFPFFIRWGFDLGLTRQTYWELRNNQFYSNLLNNPLIIIFQIIGAFCLFFFLFFQEKHSETIKRENINNDLGNIGIGRATFLGGLNIAGILFLFFGSNISSLSAESMEKWGRRPNGILLLLGILLKISVIPLIAIWTCFYFISLV